MRSWNKAPISVPQSPVLFQSTRTTSRYLSCCDRRSEAQLLLLSSVCTVKPSGLRTWLLLHCVFWLMLPSRDKTGELRGNCSEVWQNLLTSSRNGSPGLAHRHAVHSPNALRPIALPYIHLQLYITIQIDSFISFVYSNNIHAQWWWNTKHATLQQNTEFYLRSDGVCRTGQKGRRHIFWNWSKLWDGYMDFRYYCEILCLPKNVHMLKCCPAQWFHTYKCRNTVSDSGLWLDGHLALTNVESGLSPGTF